MKKLFLIAIIYSICCVANAQTNKSSVDQDSMQHYFDATANIKNNSLTETSHTKSIMRKSKKGFIKKILSNYQGFDLRNAWALLSQKQ